MASGYQIVIFIIAVEFGALFAARALVEAYPGLIPYDAQLGQMLPLAVAPFVLFGIPALRRQCLEMLRAPIPDGKVREALGATTLMLAATFGIVAIVVLMNHFADPPMALSERLRVQDEEMRWTRALSPFGALYALAVNFILAPVCEELVFRGFLHRAFEARWGWIVAMIFTSITFSLAHPTAPFHAAIASIVLVALLRRTGSMRACILAHSMYNIAFAWPLLGHLLFAIGQGPADHDPWRWSGHFAGLAVAAFGIPLYVWSARRIPRAAEPAR